MTVSKFSIKYCVKEIKTGGNACDKMVEDPHILSVPNEIQTKKQFFAWFNEQFKAKALQISQIAEEKARKGISHWMEFEVFYPEQKFCQWKGKECSCGDELMFHGSVGGSANELFTFERLQDMIKEFLAEHAIFPEIKKSENRSKNLLEQNKFYPLTMIDPDQYLKS